MIRLAVASSLACLLLAASAGARPHGATAPQAAPATIAFAISGRGWGHGIGMSQYGAYGFAQRGWGYKRILAHYYRGTQLGKAPTSRVRVLLVEGRTAVRIGSTRRFTVRDGAGETFDVEAGDHTLGRGLRLALNGEKASALTGPLLFTGRGAPLTFDGAAYRGQLEVAVVNGRLRVINHVGLDAYLYGVVPREVPYQWPAEVLKAQAVVARSYGLAVRKSGPFDLYPDTRSQVYGGMAAERAETTAAVNATAGEVVLYNGKVAVTYFFSTSGGRTAAIADAWPGATPVPYLVSVPDPYDSLSPHHRWGPYPFTGARLLNALRGRGPLLDARTEVNGSGRVETLRLVTPSGEVSASGSAVRTALGLRSSWFRVGVLALDRPERPVVTYGKKAILRGRVRGLGGAILEARPAGGAWTRVAARKGGGAIAVAVKPRLATEYRLAAGAIRTGLLRLSVAPRVRLALPDAPSSLAGTVRPKAAGMPVVLERRSDAGWRRVARASTDERGRFEAPVRLAAGTYRARVLATRGLAAGLSPPLAVVEP